MLYQISNVYKDGYVEDYISTTPNVSEDNIVNSIVSTFKYDIKSFLRPCIANIQGKKYIMPDWTPCHPNTQLSDINWSPLVKPKKPEVQQGEYKFKSSSSDSEYIVKVIGQSVKCNCPGTWRSKGNCKHVQEVKKKLGYL